MRDLLIGLLALATLFTYFRVEQMREETLAKNKEIEQQIDDATREIITQGHEIEYVTSEAR